ncbi:MAG: ferredoxin [Thiohalocapsa sp.]
MEIEAQIAGQSSLPPCVGLGEVRIEVDTPNCIGCGGCTAFATRTFVINDDLVAELTGELDDLDDLLSAAQSCPLYAITLFDGEGARLYPED